MSPVTPCRTIPSPHYTIKASPPSGAGLYSCPALRAILPAGPYSYTRQGLLRSLQGRQARMGWAEQDAGLGGSYLMTMSHFVSTPRFTQVRGYLLPVIRCGTCARGIRHDLCERTLGIGPCCCLQCHGKTMAASAIDAYRRSDDPAVLRQALGEMIAYHDQWSRRRKKIRTSEPLPAFPCACGRDGCVVTSASRYGRRTRYKDGTCRMYAYRVRERQRALQASSGPDLPARWGPGQFDAYWQSEAGIDGQVPED
jgi:hypothetical protein